MLIGARRRQKETLLGHLGAPGASAARDKAACKVVAR
jgi:hypothetical protein